MLKKIYFITSSLIIVILILVIILISINRNSNLNNNITWDNTNDYITSSISIGSVSKTTTIKTTAILDKNHFKTVTVNNDIKFKISDIIDSSYESFDLLNLDENFIGRIEDIETNTTYTILTISDFRYLYSVVNIAQEYCTNFKLNDKIKIEVNSNKIEATMTYNSYKITDGYLKIYFSYYSEDLIYEGSNVDATLPLANKNNVLRTSIDTLFIENNKYYLNVLDENNNIFKTEIEVGLIGNEYVEIIRGVKNGTKVIVNQYE